MLSQSLSDVVYEISPVKMPLIFANEYGAYDRKFGKGLLKKNDSFLNDTVDTFSTFQKVIAAPEVVKPPSSAALSPESIITRSSKQHYFSDGTPVKNIPHLKIWKI